MKTLNSIIVKTLKEHCGTKGLSITDDAVILELCEEVARAAIEAVTPEKNEYKHSSTLHMGFQMGWNGCMEDVGELAEAFLSPDKGRLFADPAFAHPDILKEQQRVTEEIEKELAKAKAPTPSPALAENTVLDKQFNPDYLVKCQHEIPFNECEHPECHDDDAVDNINTPQEEECEHKWVSHEKGGWICSKCTRCTLRSPKSLRQLAEEVGEAFTPTPSLQEIEPFEHELSYYEKAFNEMARTVNAIVKYLRHEARGEGE